MTATATMASFTRSPTMYAHLYKARSGGWTLYLSSNIDCFKPFAEISVSGKREARKIAAERGASPWNF